MLQFCAFAQACLSLEGTNRQLCKQKAGGYCAVGVTGSGSSPDLLAQWTAASGEGKRWGRRCNTVAM